LDVYSPDESVPIQVAVICHLQVESGVDHQLDIHSIYASVPVDVAKWEILVSADVEVRAIAT
jgi:hypothetical protein